MAGLGINSVGCWCQDQLTNMKTILIFTLALFSSALAAPTNGKLGSASNSFSSSYSANTRFYNTFKLCFRWLRWPPDGREEEDAELRLHRFHWLEEDFCSQLQVGSFPCQKWKNISWKIFQVRFLHRLQGRSKQESRWPDPASLLKADRPRAVQVEDL